ncbi:MAG: nicotinate (nicotinamide) nucleotide adenylyltransferase [bacterium]|nr:nicotinate (nicotinamide) nucleotide adenylyltransferase [bacterium]
MKIAILGGSFDPPHLGHYLVVKQVLDFRPDIEKILLIPTFKHQWKPSFTSVSDRMAMLKPFLDEKAELSDIELKREGVSYTIDTAKELKKQTNASLCWIIGSDILSEFHRWKRTEELLKIVKFIVFPRDPYHLPKNVPNGFEVLRDKSLITMNISSTVIRERVKTGKSIKYLVPKGVEEYIIKNKLYR